MGEPIGRERWNREQRLEDDPPTIFPGHNVSTCFPCRDEPAHRIYMALVIRFAKATLPCGP